MLASQMLYTACGKNRTGAFSVWSKSSDITQAEEFEIRDKMVYKCPRGLPYEPTAEELESLFPKMLGYFQLSSGRYCLAQSSYIGRVYSDLDMRTGNYMLHAFVFDLPERFLPMTYIGSDIFRTALSYKEWHDDPIPETLERVELEPVGKGFSESDLAFFGEGNRLSDLAQILQALLFEDVQTPVVLYDEKKNLPYWYRALSFFLPKKMQTELTFCTYFVPGTGTVNVTGQPAAKNAMMRLRTVMPDTPAMFFDYASEIRRDKPVYNMVSAEKRADREVDRYITQMLSLAQNGIAPLATTIRSVEKISASYGVPLFTALECHDLCAGRMSRFSDIGHLSRVLGIICEKDGSDTTLSPIADNLWTYGVESGRWRLEGSLSDILRFIFEYSEIADKNAIVHSYVTSPDAFGVDENASAEAYAAAMHEKAPFLFAPNFMDYIFDGERLREYCARTKRHFNATYFLYGFFAENIAEIRKDGGRYAAALDYMTNDAIAGYLKRDDRAALKELARLTERCHLQDECGFASIVMRAVDGYCGKNAFVDIFGLQRAFSFARDFAFCGVGEALFERMIRESGTYEAFVNEYIDRSAAERGFYGMLEDALERTGDFSVFLNLTWIERFRREETVRREDLLKYWEKYAPADGFDELFAEKLARYFRQQRETKGYEAFLDEILALYNERIGDGEALDERMQTCVVEMADALLSQRVTELRSYFEKKSEQKKVSEMKADYAVIRSIVRLADRDLPYEYDVWFGGAYMKRVNALLARVFDHARNSHQNEKSVFEKHASDVDRRNFDRWFQYIGSHTYDDPTHEFYGAFRACPEKAFPLFASRYMEQAIGIYVSLARYGAYCKEPISAALFRNLFFPLCNTEEGAERFVALADEFEQIGILIAGAVLCRATLSDVNAADDPFYTLADRLLQKYELSDRKKVYERLEKGHLPEKQMEYVANFMRPYLTKEKNKDKAKVKNEDKTDDPVEGKTAEKPDGFWSRFRGRGEKPTKK